jgi:hypothetical protein
MLSQICSTLGIIAASCGISLYAEQFTKDHRDRQLGRPTLPLQPARLPAQSWSERLDPWLDSPPRITIVIRPLPSDTALIPCLPGDHRPPVAGFTLVVHDQPYLTSHSNN